MSSFWSSELGEISGMADDAFAKSFTQIPDGTMALAKIDKFMNVNNNGLRYLNIEWSLIDGEFKGAKVNQKLKVLDYDGRDKDPKKTRHRALNMFKLLYQLFKLQPIHNDEPSDKDLSAFIGKKAGIKVQETNPNEEGKIYNYVSEVHTEIGFKSETGAGKVVSQIITHSTSGNNELHDNAFSRNANNKIATDDELPF